MNNYVKTYGIEKKRKKLSLASKIIFSITALTVILHIISAFSSTFSDFFNLNISSAVRFVTAKITNLLPFSLAEALILLIPVIAFILIRYASKKHTDSWSSVFTYITSLLSVACLFYVLFFWSFGVGYNTESIDKKLDLERKDISAQELYDTALILSEKVNEEAKNVSFRSMNFSIMPYDISELSKKLNEDFKAFSSDNKFISNFKSNVKPIILSRPMSYTHITGIYSYFTGEANLNTHFPDYTLPFTAAHEFAHQRGIAREDEANFIAFLVCKESSDPYIRYSAYVNMLDYVLNALYVADENLYSSVVRSLNDNILYEFIAYADFFDQFKDSVASSVSGTINDSYLKLNGTEGEKSYGMVVDLAVAYYKNN